jgi:hypothetical protein
VDSCFLGDAASFAEFDGQKQPSLHHAYSQPENDNAPVIPVIVKGKTFYCHPWMISQAQEFMDLIRVMGNEMELDVRGPGLLSWIVEAGAIASEEAIMSLA